MPKHAYILKLGKMAVSNLYSPYYIFQIEMLRAKDEIIMYMDMEITKLRYSKLSQSTQD